MKTQSTQKLITKFKLASSFLSKAVKSVRPAFFICLSKFSCPALRITTRFLLRHTLFIVSYFNVVAKYFYFDYYVEKYYRVNKTIMKKVVLLITVLFVSVISTACINNLAVQELNNKAQEYMANGETEKAISRLRSSIDLDSSIFETHYNLGIALIAAHEYKDAQEALNNAIKLNPDYADTYYSLAMAYEEEGFEIINEGNEELKDLPETENLDPAKKRELTQSQKTQIIELFNSAIDNYNIYLTKKTDDPDKEKIESQVTYLNRQIEEYNGLKSNEIEDLRQMNNTKKAESSNSQTELGDEE